ncbi:hypothetical protein LTR05_005704 [Lithohypha guttulata]|uniref:Uncharacterized protein n=1 Tax=Lithohypha guttulata TaxID=1690604 RepID=A0AAN7SYX2_9EURO|nr:hypothetical protein LTR05_005704 [Lithohypha guttulata]
MDEQDIEMPSPKRQRTSLPEDTPSNTAQPAIWTPVAVPGITNDAPTKQERLEDITKESLATDTGVLQATSQLPEEAKSDGTDMLDFLMQHVESESTSIQPGEPVSNAAHSVEGPPARSKDEEPISDDVEMQEQEVTANTAQDLGQNEDEQLSKQESLQQSAEQSSLFPPPGLEAAAEPVLQQLRQAAEANNLPPTADTLVQDHIPPATHPVPADTVGDLDCDTGGVALGAPDTEEREWATDSSPYSSDSDTSSDDSSDDSDDDDGDEYTLLDPYEQARILMAEDGGGAGADSDDEGTTRPQRVAGGGGAGLRTTNEKSEDILPKPGIVVTEDMSIIELGKVEAIVENTVLIKATVSVSETLGRVEQPLYTVRFASSDDISNTFSLNPEQNKEDAKGTKVYYVKDHSTFVFTQPLRAAKGTDASNIHDEEVGEDEMEFSDDEAEAEYKRLKKLQRKGIDPNSQQGQAGGRGGRGGRGQRGNRGRGGLNHNNMPDSSSFDTASMYSYNGGRDNVQMNYDDAEDGETSIDYTPLRRPETMSNIQMSPPGQTYPQAQSHQQYNSNNNNRGNYNQNRDQRGRGRGNNRGRGNRGNFQNQNHSAANRNNYSPSSSNSMYYNNNNNIQYPTQAPQQQQYHPPMPPAPPQQQHQQQGTYYAYSHAPNAPHLPPSSAPNLYGNNTNMPPSPMTPLPPGADNYAYQNQWAQYHANQAQQAASQQGQYGSNSINADALAQVQRQLEEMRRHAQGS